MEFSRELLFFFSALGAFNGLLLGLYFLLFARPKHLSNYFLGALLISLSIRIGKSVFFYFEPDLAGIYLQIGLSMCVFIGPFLYFYFSALLRPEENIKKYWSYHFIPLVGLVVIIGVLYPFETNAEFWRFYVIDLIYKLWLVYLTLAGVVLKPVLQKLWRREELLSSLEIWMVSIFLGNAVIWIAYNTCGFTSYILGALSFSFMLYLLILLFVFNKNKKNMSYKSLPKYRDKKIEDVEASEYLVHLESIMQQEELYKNPNLKLPEVAAKLKMLPHRLSQLLNDNLGKSFPSFINEYRINAAQKMIVSNGNYSLEAIGYECGFNSKSTFYTAFKKVTGMTPAQFKQESLD